MSNNRILDGLTARPYRIADSLMVHANTVQRWITFLSGRSNTSFQPCRPRKNIRPLLARVLGVTLDELNEAFGDDA
jgi:hypothetical protein